MLNVFRMDQVFFFCVLVVVSAQARTLVSLLSLLPFYPDPFILLYSLKRFTYFSK